MLVQFTVENYRSFKERNTFSMRAANIAAPEKRVDQENTFEETGVSLLKAAAIYGANASGKSNFVKALGFMRRFVLNSAREGQATDRIPSEPFRLSTETIDAPTMVEIIFILKGDRYRYGFEVTRKQVIGEWLYRTRTTREMKLFEREHTTIDVGSSFKEGRGLEDRTRENALFLSVVAQFNGSIAGEVVQWLDDLNIRIGVNDLSDRLDTTRQMAAGGYHNEIVGFVKGLDLGIEDIETVEREPRVKVELTSDGDPEASPPYELDRVFRDLMEYGKTRVRTIHRVYDSEGRSVTSRPFDLEQHESEGTKKLFGLAGQLIGTLNAGHVLVVDELDARLHPLITCAIIELFQNPKTNPRNAQLIFTTHDTNLLSNTRFRRDQIWFAEKDRRGGTHLYSLIEYKVRNDASFEKDYIKGRYGAIPYIGDFTHLVGAEDA